MLVHTPSKSLLLRLRPDKLAQLRELFPKHSRPIDYQGHNLAVPHNLNMVRVLRNMGIAAPSPIRHYYAWPRPPRFATVFDHQYDTAEFLTLHARCFVLNEQGCVDADTEYLSPTGWKRIADYDGGEVTQYDLDTGTAELVQPKEYVKLPCAEMIRFKTTYGIDQLLSPEHRVLYWGSTGKPAVQPAREVEAAHHKAKRGWAGRIATTFSTNRGSEIKLTDAQLRVQVAVIADGHFGKGSKWCTMRLKKERKKSRMRALLVAAGIEFKETMPEYESAKGFSVFKFYAPLRKKEFDADFWHASPAQLELIASEVYRWDGSVRKAGAVEFCSTSKASADFVQYCFAATGRSARMMMQSNGRERPLYNVYARSTPMKLGIKSVDPVTNEKNETVWREPSPDGFKYCFEVPKTFLVLRRNGCVFVTGNTAKTSSTLWAADYLMEQGLVKRVLIVAKLSTLEQVWLNEIFDVCMHRTALVLHADADKRRELLKREVDFYIINHDGLKILSKDIVARKDIDLVIVDEASAYRNATTDQYKVLEKVAKNKKLWLLTGTPCPNAPTDAWALARLVNPARVPEYFTQFKKQTMNQISTYKWVPKPGSHEIAYNAMQPAIRFKKSECLDLPPVTYTSRKCELSKEQETAYSQMKNLLVLQAQNTPITAVNAADKISKLRQVLCGAVKQEDGDYLVLDHAPRLKVLLEAIEEASAKVLVIVPFKGIVQVLAKEVQAWHDKRGDSRRVEVVNGDVSPRERGRIFQDFRDDDNLTELICHPKVMAHGLNLTQADMVIFYAPIYSNEEALQVMDRINRPGQMRKMTILRIAANGLEQGIYSMLQNRAITQESILALYKKELQLGP